MRLAVRRYRNDIELRYLTGARVPVAAIPDIIVRAGGSGEVVLP